MKLTEYKGFKVGDTVEIDRDPVYWASSLCKHNPPSDKSGKYPLIITIKDISSEGEYTAMTCGNYGWDFVTLISKDLIKKVNSLEVCELY